MRAFWFATTAGLLAFVLMGTGFAMANEAQGSLTTTPIVELTMDPCEETPVSDAGEEIDPCVTETPQATVDPCETSETDQSGEVDPCATETSTPTVTDPDPTATMTPTLEYEIDVPVSFFPTETIEPGPEETVAAATQVGGEGTSGVTGLPNTGGSGPNSSAGGWVVMLAIVFAMATIGLIARSNREAER